MPEGWTVGKKLGSLNAIEKCHSLQPAPLAARRALPKSLAAGAHRGRRSRGCRPAPGDQTVLYPCCSMEDVAMRTTLDFAPLFRSSIGFDRMLDALEAAS